MKVALDASAVPARVAGAGRYIVELAGRLPAHVATTVVTRRDDTQRWAAYAPSATIRGIVPSGRAGRLAFEAFALGTSEPARSADVWHAPHYTMPHRGRTPTVVTIHDLTFFTNPEWHERTKVTFFRRAITYAARHANALVCVSDFTARQLDEYLPEHAPVVVAPHGVNLERFSPDGDEDDALLTSGGFASGTPYLLYLGTLEPRKGIDVLIASFESLAAQDPTLELWLAGQRGWGLDDVEASLASHPFADRIRRLGFVDDLVLPALLRRARAVVYPSRGEGFGLPVLEAMACGAPVVTSADTVMAEVAGDAAFLAAPGSAADLTASLVAALALDDDERRTWAARARTRAELFTWERSVDQHLLAYRLAMGER